VERGVSGGFPALAAALGGGLAVVAVRDALAATPAASRWLMAALEPAKRARSEGYVPSVDEVRRLALLGAASLLAAGWWLVGAAPAFALALAGPAAVSWAIATRRGRYRREVEGAIPAISVAIADAMAGGRSVRAAVGAACWSLEGSAAAEMSRVAADLELGASLDAALAGLRGRVRSPRVDSMCTALLSQRLAGGDLIGLLRRSAESGAERARADSDARSATAQARFTGILVVAMPAGAGLLAELLSPGFVSGLLADGISTTLVLGAVALQVLGFVAIRRLSKVQVA
jgi:tight adherence protein B